MSANPPNARSPQKWQFDLRSLLRWVVYASIVLALVRWLGIAGFIFASIFTSPLLFCLRRPRPEVAVMKCLIVYFALGMVTLPFINKLWLGEIAPLVIFQWPKTQIANWVRDLIVMHAMRPLGLSSGSLSPDWTAARPWALAITYIVPLAVFLTIVGFRTRMENPYFWWACALLVFAVADFCMILAFADPGLIVY